MTSTTAGVLARARRPRTILARALCIAALTGAALSSGLAPTASAATTPYGTWVHPAALTARLRPAIAPTMARNLHRLRSCESSGNYRTNTGNGFYGAYQFDMRTWRSVGMRGLPHHATPRAQDLAAARLEARRGWQPWPHCARVLRLR